MKYLLMIEQDDIKDWGIEKIQHQRFALRIVNTLCASVSPDKLNRLQGQLSQIHNYNGRGKLGGNEFENGNLDGANIAVAHSSREKIASRAPRKAFTIGVIGDLSNMPDLANIDKIDDLRDMEGVYVSSDDAYDDDGDDNNKAAKKQTIATFKDRMAIEDINVCIKSLDPDANNVRGGASTNMDGFENGEFDNCNENLNENDEKKDVCLESDASSIQLKQNRGGNYKRLRASTMYTNMLKVGSDECNIRSISIISTKINRNGKNSVGIYILSVTDVQNQRWLVEKRFRQFWEFNRCIAGLGVTMINASFPKKVVGINSIFSQTSKSANERLMKERTRKLNAYLNELVQRSQEEVHIQDYLKQFVAKNSKVPNGNT